jgi:hypothetical protein
MVNPGERVYMPRAGLPVGSAVGNIIRVVPPPPVDAWTWVNQGTATASNVSDGILMSAPSAATLSIKILVRPTPGTPWTATLGYVPDHIATAQEECGLLARESGTGEVITVGHGGAAGMTAQKFNSPTSLSGPYTLTNVPLLYHGMSVPQWLRMVDDGTNRITYYSRDGQNWRQVHTVGRTDFLTVDTMGFYARVDNGFAAIKVVSWELVNGLG